MSHSAKIGFSSSSDDQATSIEGDESEILTRTGPRPLTSEPQDAELEAVSTDSTPKDNDSIRPESLRTPFASLTPPPKSDSTPPPAQSTDHRPSPLASKTPSYSSSGTTRPTRRICAKHKLARNQQGECLMCNKEAAREKHRWQWPVIIIGLAVACGIILSALL